MIQYIYIYIYIYTSKIIDEENTYGAEVNMLDSEFELATPMFTFGLIYKWKV